MSETPASLDEDFMLPGASRPADGRMPSVPRNERVENIIRAANGDVRFDSMTRQQLQVLIECPHCAEVYTDAHQLPCQHSLCKHCIADCTRDHLVVCPVCQQESDPDEAKPDITKEELMRKNQDAKGKSHIVVLLFCLKSS